MSDDWSLGNHWMTIKKGAQIIFGATHTYYRKEDVLLLRQKLIEEFAKDGTGPSADRIPPGTVIDIINKRFGEIP